MLADHISVGVHGRVLVWALLAHGTVAFLPCAAEWSVLVEAKVVFTLEEVTEGKVPCVIAWS